MNVSQFLSLLWRRKWLFIVPLLVTPALAIALTARQDPTYQAQSQVLLSYRDIAGGGVDSSAVQRDAKRNAETQARLARVPAVAQRVVTRAGASLTPEEFLSKSDVASSPNADLLTFSVRDGDPDRAAFLATEYGRQFTAYRQELDTAAVTRARQEVEARIRALRADAGPNAEVASALVTKAEELRTLEALQTSNAFLVESASKGTQIAPQPLRTAAFATFVALLLAVGLVLLVDALDNRTRTVDELAQQLGLARLGRIPRPARRAGTATALMETSDLQADAFRMLRANIDFQNVDGGTRVLMVTSAVASEGKSTTLTHLAIAFAKAGRRIALVDLDLRRPVLHRHFQLSAQPGITDVALGTHELDDALNRIDIGTDEDRAFRDEGGHVDVLVAGGLPPDPGQFVATGAVAGILDRLAGLYDLVLIDAPPALAASDALSLSTRVDAVFVVTRLSSARRPAIGELAAILKIMPARKLGFVSTGERLANAGYYGYGDQPPGRKSRRVGAESSRP